MCNYHIQTVKRHILGQTATCAVHLCVCACVCLCATECKNGTLLVFSVEMPHLSICSCKLCCVLVCRCVYCMCMYVAEH